MNFENTLEKRVSTQKVSFINKAEQDFTNSYLGKDSPLTRVTREFLAYKLKNNISSLFEVTQKIEDKNGIITVTLNIGLTETAKRLLHQAQKIENISLALETEKKAAWDGGKRLLVKNIRTPEELEISIGQSGSLQAEYLTSAREKFNRWFAGRPAIIEAIEQKLNSEIATDSSIFPTAESSSFLCSNLIKKLNSQSIKISNKVTASEQVLPQNKRFKKLKVPFYKRPVPLTLGFATMLVLISYFETRNKNNNDNDNRTPVSLNSIQTYEVHDDKIVPVPTLPEELKAITNSPKLVVHSISPVTIESQNNFLNSIQTPVLRSMIQTEFTNYNATNGATPTPLTNQLNEAYKEIKKYRERNPLSHIPSFGQKNNSNDAKALEEYLEFNPGVNPFVKEELSKVFGGPQNKFGF